MRRMCQAAALGTLILLLAGCGSTANVDSATGPSKPAPSSLAGSGPRTTDGTARFTLSVVGVIGGVNVSADENGTVSFVTRSAHIYKLILGGGIPQELVVDGPITYTNGDVEAAMNDPSVKPWTKLDTRRLPAKQRSSESDELMHVRAPAYLVYGVKTAERLGTNSADDTTHFRGTVDLVRLAARLPAGDRADILAAVRRDYVDHPFKADFWVDASGRLRRVHVSYRTPGGGRIAVNAAYSAFGTQVDLVVPPAREVQDITP
jgi:hypothetical protein